MLRRRHVTGLCTGLVAAGALVLTSLPSQAAAAPSPSPAAPTAAETAGADQASPQLLRAMQRDLDLTREQAERRLVNEAEAGATAGALRLALGQDFAGAWVSGAESGALTVATTDAADAATIEADGARAVVVSHSLAELEAARAELDRAATRTSTLDAPVRYVDVAANTVVVRAVRTAAGERLVEASGVDSALVKVERAAERERPRPLYDLVGGEAYYMGSGGRCSVGFPVTKGSTQGFATAGHCGTVGTTTTGANQVAQGTFQGSTFPGRDMAWVAANSSWTATPYVKQGASLVEVTGSTQAPVGSSVCRSGSTTGWHCGVVQVLNTSVTYPEGTITGVTQTSVCAEPGDSGGSYISGSQAQGVTSGGSGNCSSGGTTFFQPINPLLQTYGLTLRTTGNNGGDPGEPGGSWAAGTVYQAGDEVTYGDATYRCLQPHQAQSAWNPADSPALWQRV
ncbi:S1 family peptidase [Streptomyces triticagri]|uniref:S1 family peptidase n=1 Tax=Streptomyces triticagri TaxID=2293568 RepID=A0A372MCL6_9ACTN|nr:carbohydrate-binding protein [Streptomyces triticagri]RFU88245.1 S1 family peptidase [Streptomyces triticagri]